MEVTEKSDETAVNDAPAQQTNGAADEAVEIVVEDGVDEFGGASDDEIQLARDNGWSGLAGWKGDPGKFETAKSFAERSKGINAVLKREISKLEAKQQSELTQIRKDVSEFQEMVRKSAEKELNNKVFDLRARRVQAINEGDGVGVDAAERELEALRVAATPKPAPAVPVAPPALAAEEQRVVSEFQTRNPWFDVDKRKTTLAMAVADEVRRDSPHLQGKTQAFLQELETRLTRDYPEVYGNGRMASARTESGDPPRNPQRVVKRTFDNLPREAQQACERLVKQGVVKKKEDYVKAYFESEGAR